MKKCGEGLGSRDFQECECLRRLIPTLLSQVQPVQINSVAVKSGTRPCPVIQSARGDICWSDLKPKIPLLTEAWSEACVYKRGQATHHLPPEGVWVRSSWQDLAWLIFLQTEMANGWNYQDWGVTAEVIFPSFFFFFLNTNAYRSSHFLCLMDMEDKTDELWGMLYHITGLFCHDRNAILGRRLSKWPMSKAGNEGDGARS